MKVYFVRMNICRVGKMDKNWTDGEAESQTWEATECCSIDPVIGQYIAVWNSMRRYQLVPSRLPKQEGPYKPIYSKQTGSNSSYSRYMNISSAYMRLACLSSLVLCMCYPKKQPNSRLFSPSPPHVPSGSGNISVEHLHTEVHSFTCTLLFPASLYFVSVCVHVCVLSLLSVHLRAFGFRGGHCISSIA